MSCSTNSKKANLAAVKCGLSATASKAAYIAANNSGALLFGAVTGALAGLENYKRSSLSYQQQAAQAAQYKAALRGVIQTASQALASSNPRLRARLITLAKNNLTAIKNRNYAGLSDKMKSQFLQHHQVVETWLARVVAAEAERAPTRAFIFGAARAGAFGTKNLSTPTPPPPSLQNAVGTGLLAGTASLLAASAVVAWHSARRQTASAGQQNPASHQSGIPETIPMQPVNDSSLVSSLGYDEETQTLALTFKSSKQTYLYNGVPADVGQEFLTASKKGAFFHQNIRGQYQSKRLGL